MLHIHCCPGPKLNSEIWIIQYISSGDNPTKLQKEMYERVVENEKQSYKLVFPSLEAGKFMEMCNISILSFFPEKKTYM